MNRVNTLLKSFVANPTYGEVLRVQLGVDRLTEIATGTVKISPNEANIIQRATDDQVNSELLLQLNEDDLAVVPQKRTSPKKTSSARSSSVSMRHAPPPTQDW